MKKIFIIVFFLTGMSLHAFTQDWVLKQIQESPRHQEWVEVEYAGRKVSCFVVYPEVSHKATAIIVIHENRGLNDWTRSMTDQIAGEGYIAIAPDLLSGSGPNGGKTSDFANQDDARNALYALSPDQVTNDLNAVFEYAQKIPAANGKVAVTGFCWGGSQTFRYATNNPKIAAAFVFYGSGPDAQSDIDRIATNVFGFYGGNDARVNATIEESEKMMKNAGKFYEPVVYDGGGHGFMRSGQDPEGSPENKKAREDALVRFRSIMSNL